MLKCFSPSEVKHEAFCSSPKKRDKARRKRHRSKGQSSGFKEGDNLSEETFGKPRTGAAEGQ